MDISMGQEDCEISAQNADILASLQQSRFEYSPFNIAGIGCKEDPSLSSYDGCSCVTKSCCTEMTCGCNLRNYEGRKLRDMQSSNPIYECNSSCKCGDTCQNRLVQHGVRIKLEVFDAGEKGFGLRPVQNVERWTFVCEYAGEVIGRDEAIKRTIRQDSLQEPNYLITVSEFYTNREKVTTYVDPKNKGNIGRFINHSCDPNLIMIPVRVDSLIPHLALFALKDIKTGEELTFDYSGGCLKQRQNTELYSQRKPCLCRTSNCTGFLPLDPTSLLL